MVAIHAFRIKGPFECLNCFAVIALLFGKLKIADRLKNLPAGFTADQRTDDSGDASVHSECIAPPSEVH